MATALTAVPAPAASVSEALAVQLIDARVRIDQLIQAHAAVAGKALGDAKRAAAEQAAQALARGEKPEVSLVPQLAERVLAVTTLEEQNKRNGEQLVKLKWLLDQRVDELKQSPGDRVPLLRLLKSQRAKLDAEIKSRSGETDQLEAQRGRIADEIEALEGCGPDPAEEPAPAAAATTAAARRGGGKR